VPTDPPTERADLTGAAGDRPGGSVLSIAVLQGVYVRGTGATLRMDTVRTCGS